MIHLNLLTLVLPIRPYRICRPRFPKALFTSMCPTDIRLTFLQDSASAAVTVAMAGSIVGSILGTIIFIQIHIGHRGDCKNDQPNIEFLRCASIAGS
jgi:hypothetical protein